MADQPEPFTSFKQITATRKYYHDTYRDKTAHALISSAKTRLLLDHPFWGFMGLDLVLVEAPHKEVPTLCTDGYHIFYSASFINSLPPGQVEFAVAHEIYHCLWGHTMGEGKVNRRGDRDPKLWNKATDFVINNDLKNAGVGEFITVIKILYDPKYDGWSAERVYEDLLKNPPPEDMQLLDVHVEFEVDPDMDQSSSGSGDPSSEDEQSQEDGDNSDDGEGSEDKRVGAFSSNSDEGEDGEGEGEGEQSKTRKEDDTIVIKVSPQQAQEEAQRWQEVAQRAVAHIENSSQNAGSIPEHLRRLIGELIKPKINWKAALRKFVINTIRTGYSFVRPDKRTFSSGITIPGFRRVDKKLIIVVAIDTSGSISREELNAFISELLGVMESFTSYEIHAFCFEGDVEETTYKVIKKTHKSPKDDLLEYAEQITGGGGTNFQSIWSFLRRKRIKPRGMVIFTDGFPNDNGWHNEGSYCPTMFLTVGNPGWKAPFGMTITYENQ